ncbi:MAG: hypothetical protein ABSF62_10210 [Bryobacteraceae bacterium]|jgi:hypothetical protein
MRARLLVVLLGISSAGWGADWEFDRVVKAIEHQYGVRQTHVPLMGVANFFVQVVRPGGATGFKLAVFENLRSDEQDEVELDRFMDRIGESDLHRLLRVHSRRNGESAYIYLGDLGRTTKMLLVTFDRNEATVMQVNLNIDALLRMLNDPGKGRRDYCCGAGSR